MYNSNDLKDITNKLVKLDHSKRQFINGLITGLEISESDQNIREPALAAPAAKEPEKQEDVKQMPIEVEESVNKILKELEESGKRYDLILPNLYTLEEPKK